MSHNIPSAETAEKCLLNDDDGINDCKNVISKIETDGTKDKQ